MRKPLEVSTVIPTRNRASHLQKLLDCLDGQSLPADRHEVIVVLDGPDRESADVADRYANRLRIRVIPAARLGIAHAKNEALAAVEGRIVVLLNDDVRPVESFLETHIAAHDERRSGPPAMVLGYSPFLARAEGEDTLFDRLVRETSMIFFYDRMVGADGRPLAPREHDWGYRHAWNMNLSLLREAAVEVGGFVPAIANCCYEDVEFAWRVNRAFGSPVQFEIGALAPHDHVYTPEGYLERERRLGYSAYGFALAAPECARAVFGREVGAPADVQHALMFLEREAKSESRLMEAFESLARIPAGEIGGPHAVALRSLICGQHLLLKRLAFSRGLVEASRGGQIQGLFHPSDGLPTAPPLARSVAA